MAEQESKEASSYNFRLVVKPLMNQGIEETIQCVADHLNELMDYEIKLFDLE